MLFPFTSAERLWNSDLQRFCIPIAQKQKQKTTWVLGTWCKGLGVKYPVAALLVYPHLVFGKCQRAVWLCHAVHGLCWEWLSVLLGAGSLSHGDGRDHHSWVLQTSGVLKMYTSCWCHSAADSLNIFQWFYFQKGKWTYAFLKNELPAKTFMTKWSSFQIKWALMKQESLGFSKMNWR